jgi:hypothetical protein
MSEKIYQVLRPDGTFYIPEDARPGDPHASWIYTRYVADLFARDVGGTVVELGVLPTRPITTDPGHKLTASQSRNLKAVRAAGRLYRHRFQFYATLGGEPIRGLNRNTMDRLVRLGLLKVTREVDARGYGYEIFEVAT